MRKLILVRHAESGKDVQTKIPDYERPLLPSGQSDAELAGKWLQSQNSAVPALILCSNATRTRETLAAVCKGYNEAFEQAESEKPKEKDSKDKHKKPEKPNPYADLYYPQGKEHQAAEVSDLSAVKTVYTNKLYEASWEAMLQLIHKVDDDTDSLMVVGHNPAIGELATKLLNPTSGWAPSAMQMKKDFPPGAIAYFNYFCYTAGKLGWKGCVVEGGAILIGFADPTELKEKAEKAEKEAEKHKKRPE
jgi:phosphohistidine phosphatase